MINPEYLELIRQSYDTEEEVCEALFFGFLMENRDEFPFMESYLLDGKRSIIPYEKFQELFINFVSKDTETGKNLLKVPLMGIDTSDYSDFLLHLSLYHVGSMGHLNNKTKFSIFSLGDLDKKGYRFAKEGIGKGFNPERMAMVTSYYYENAEFPSKLCNFLGTQNSIQAYKDYTV
jgi:hypothetical protein